MSSQLIQNHVNDNDLIAPFNSLIESSFFSLENSLNPQKNNRLFQAARKILAIMPQIKQQKKSYDTSKLRHYLLTEFYSFQQEAKNEGCDPENILISSYSLSALLDETINKTPWGTRAHWHEQNLLQTLQKETNADERFFTILEKICELPEKYIDTIELMYISLSLGFEGKFRDQIQGRHKLQNIIDYTYDVIRNHRGEINKKLSPSLTKPQSLVKQKKSHHLFWSIVLVTSLSLTSVYYSLNYLLNISTNQTSQQIENIIVDL